MRRLRRNCRGFTMVELVIISVVLSIFILATITYINPQTQFKKARDTRRRSDLADYRTALEAYSAVHDGMYPSFISGNILRLDTTVYTGALQPYMSSAPSDPVSFSTDTPYVYHYVAEYAPGGADGMALIDALEAKENTFWIICSTGKTGEYYLAADLWDEDNRVTAVNNFCGFSIGS